MAGRLPFSSFPETAYATASMGRDSPDAEGVMTRGGYNGSASARAPVASSISTPQPCFAQAISFGTFLDGSLSSPGRFGPSSRATSRAHARGGTRFRSFAARSIAMMSRTRALPQSRGP
jgi:hypothetical protein